MKILFAIAALILCSSLARSEPISSERITVVDGDTIRIDLKRPDYRLVGFNAPETKKARNAVELEIGTLATQRLEQLVREGDLDFTPVPCACLPGTEGTMACNFKRHCGVLKAKGVDVAKTLIEEMLAVEYVCGPTRCPKLPTPWR